MIAIASLKSSLGSEKIVRFCVLTFGLWLHAACSLLAATTLPSAIDEIGGANIIGWAFTLYQLGSILAGAATGLIVSRLGFRFALLSAGSIYILGSTICAIAGSMEVLVGGRLIQGLGGGWLVALTFVVTNRDFPDKLIPRLQAILSAVWSVSAFCGPLIGGTFSTLGMWRVAFWAFAIQGVLFLFAVYFTFKETSSDNTDSEKRFPLLRLILLAGSILTISIAGLSTHSIILLLLIAISVLLFWQFLKLDHLRPESRMFPTHPFHLNHRIGACLILVFTAASATMTFLVFGPYFLEKLYGLTPLASGYIILLESIGWGIAAIAFSGQKNDTLMIRCGVFLVTAGVAGFALAMPNDQLYLVMAFALLQGAGFGMMWGFIIKNAVSSVDESERDVTSSALPTTQQISFAVGAAVAGIIANTLGFGDDIDHQLIRQIAFWVFAAFVPLALFANYAAWKFTSAQGMANSFK